MPQIVHNHKTRCEGLSITMFFFTITGNVTYVASILFKSLDERYVFANLPWLWCVLFIHLLPFFLFPSSPLPSSLPSDSSDVLCETLYFEHSGAGVTVLLDFIVLGQFVTFARRPQQPLLVAGDEEQD